MRTLHKLALFTIAACAAMALSAVPATAETESPVEVSNEEIGGHCDPCPVHASSEADTTVFTAHSGGIEAVQTRCTDEFSGTIGEDGEGQFNQIIMTGPGGVCNAIPCATSSGQVHWPFHIREHRSGDEELEITFCLFQADGSFGFCSIDVAVTDLGGHHYELTANDENCHGSGQNPAVEVDGHWLIEGENIEITHP